MGSAESCCGHPGKTEKDSSVESGARDCLLVELGDVVISIELGNI